MASNDQTKPAADVAQQDPADGTDPGENGGDIAALKRELEELRSNAQRLQDQWLRGQAEMDNLRKRTAREMEGARKYAIEQFANAVLSVKDSLELGLGAARDTQDIAKLKEGMELTLKQLQQALEKFQIREVGAVGQPFNPEHHQAMMMQESSAHAPNTVLTVMTKGYTLNDRLLRPATVIVSKAPGN